MTKVLVTGGNGQLATCIKDVASNYPNLNFIYTDYEELDICDLKSVEAFFEQIEGIEYCINCAAYTAVDKAEEDTDKAFAINAEGPKNLAKACLENNTTLIQVSTDFVFDGKATLPYKESDVANPISVYGASKLKGEEEIISRLENYFILRTAWLYSEHGNNFMKTMLKLAETRDELSVVSDQIGTPTYAKDLAEVILKIISSKNINYGLYHYSNEGTASWFDFAKAIFKFSKSNIEVKAIPTKEFPTPAQRPKFSVLNKTKIIENLNIAIPHWELSLKQVTNDMIKDI